MFYYDLKWHEIRGKYTEHFLLNKFVHPFCPLKQTNILEQQTNILEMKLKELGWVNSLSHGFLDETFFCKIYVMNGLLQNPKIKIWVCLN